MIGRLITAAVVLTIGDFSVSCWLDVAAGLVRKVVVTVPGRARGRRAGTFAYRVDVPGDDEVIGNAPLADGMSLSFRLRRDFTVTDAGRLLATARRVYRELNPDVSAEEAGAMVTCAADALFVILEHAGLLGDATDKRLADHAADGLAVEGWRAEAVVNEPEPLSPEPRGNCLRGDVFALPDRHQD